MRILLTGMNKNQCTENFYLRQQLKVIPSHYSLVRCLRDMGHEVEQRSVELGENLTGYDRVIVFLAGPRQLVSVNFFNGLSAIAHAKKDALILAFDDWQTKGIFDGIQSCKDPEKMFAKFVLGVNKKEIEELTPWAAVFQDAVDIVLEKTAPVLLSVFAGGDMSLLIDYPEDKLFGYNPNPYHHNRKPGDRDDIPNSELGAMELAMVNSAREDCVHPSEKVLGFNFASLVQSQTKKWLKKQGVLEWEVEFFGNKKEGQRRLKEGDMVQVYAEQWASLMPGYPHAGSGWWRARPLQVADANSILIGEPKEMEIYYGKTPYANLTAQDVEKMNVTQLSETANEQRFRVYARHPLDKDVQKAELQRVLDI